MTFLVVVAVLLVNLLVPRMDGRLLWSTGPRLLVPLIPFAMLPVAAALLAGDSRWANAATKVLRFAHSHWPAAHSCCCSNLLEGGFPQITATLLFRPCGRFGPGRSPLPVWHDDERFCRNLASLIAPGWIDPDFPRAGNSCSSCRWCSCRVVAILGLRVFGTGASEVARFLSIATHGRRPVWKGRWSSPACRINDRPSLAL